MMAMDEREPRDIEDEAESPGAEGGPPFDLRDIFPRRQGIHRIIGRKRLVVLGLFLPLVIGAWYLRAEGLLRPELLSTVVDDYPILTALAFLLIYVLSVLGTLPTLLLNLAAGLFWGPVLGGLIATAASGGGAVGAFLIARGLLGRPLARRVDNRFVAWLQDEFEAKGWRFIAFVRVNPVFPTGALNCILGLTSVRTSTYILASLLFLFPPTLAFAIVGYEIGSFVVEGEVKGLV